MLPYTVVQIPRTPSCAFGSSAVASLLSVEPKRDTELRSPLRRLGRTARWSGVCLEAEAQVGRRALFHEDDDDSVEACSVRGNTEDRDKGGKDGSGDDDDKVEGVCIVAESWNNVSDSRRGTSQDHVTWLF